MTAALRFRILPPIKTPQHWLSADDRRHVARLVGECGELGAEPHAWGLHLICELRAALGFQIGTLGMSREPFPAAFAQGVLGVIDHGWSDAGQLGRFREDWRDGYGATEPFAKAFACNDWSVKVVRGQDVCSSDEWHGSMHFNDFYRLSGLEHTMPAGTVPPADSGVAFVFMNLIRPLGDRHYEERDRRFFETVLYEINARIGRGLMPFGRANRVGLPRRHAEVLALLFRGCAENEIAASLGIGAATVHCYVKALHHRLGAHCRAELLRRYAELLCLSMPKLVGLPPRLGQVLERLLVGYTEERIARDLSISPYTVHDHVKRLCKGFGASGTAHLLFLARFAVAAPQPRVEP